MVGVGGVLCDYIIEEKYECCVLISFVEFFVEFCWVFVLVSME